jgi:hypothetical protein
MVVVEAAATTTAAAARFVNQFRRRRRRLPRGTFDISRSARVAFKKVKHRSCANAQVHAKHFCTTRCNTKVHGAMRDVYRGATSQVQARGSAATEHHRGSQFRSAQRRDDAVVTPMASQLGEERILPSVRESSSHSATTVAVTDEVYAVLKRGVLPTQKLNFDAWWNAAKEYFHSMSISVPGV